MDLVSTCTSSRPDPAASKPLGRKCRTDRPRRILCWMIRVSLLAEGCRTLACCRPAHRLVSTTEDKPTAAPSAIGEHMGRVSGVITTLAVTRTISRRQFGGNEAKGLRLPANATRRTATMAKSRGRRTHCDACTPACCARHRCPMKTDRSVGALRMVEITFLDIHIRRQGPRRSRIATWVSFSFPDVASDRSTCTDAERDPKPARYSAVRRTRCACIVDIVMGKARQCRVSNATCPRDVSGPC